jgi:hypothetical protein
MPLIPQATLNAAEIDGINRSLTAFIRNQLERSYALVMTDPQAVLDALGTNAVAALTRYATLYSALSTLGEANGVIAPNFDIFQPQPDGSVLYVAPPEPEPTPDPEP